MSDKIEMKPVKVDHVKLNNLLKGFVILFVIIVLWKCFGGFWIFGGSSTSSNTAEKSIEFSNVSLKNDGVYTEVVGEANNKGNENYTFTMTVTFYDSEHKIIATAPSSVENLKAGGIKTFTSIAKCNLPADYKIQIDSIGSAN